MLYSSVWISLVGASATLEVSEYVAGETNQFLSFIDDDDTFCIYAD